MDQLAAGHTIETKVRERTADIDVLNSSMGDPNGGHLHKIGIVIKLQTLLNRAAKESVVVSALQADDLVPRLKSELAQLHIWDDTTDIDDTILEDEDHLLWLKVAACTTLSHKDFWRLFGKGKHFSFRNLLLTKLSPHLSSRAFQYSLDNAYALWGICVMPFVQFVGSHLFSACCSAFRDFLATKTLNEQRNIWLDRIRLVLLSKLVCKLVVNQEGLLWAALGVPNNQLAMIESEAFSGPNPTDRRTRSHAIWRHMVNTLDPVAEQTHVGADNFYYQVRLTGAFTRKCHRDYLSEKVHAKFSSTGALDGLRIHMEEVGEVLNHIPPDTLTVVVVIDHRLVQPERRSCSLKIGARVLLIPRYLSLGIWRCSGPMAFLSTELVHVQVAPASIGSTYRIDDLEISKLVPEAYDGLQEKGCGASYYLRPQVPLELWSGRPRFALDPLEIPYLY
ncbi:uncharacterized protein N7479_011303 [Penicillium vulpinum]|uniref:uncharacterized protein n=1 Tax=Penicillium vulpinum TaxID=29845 RepID=UPI0025496DB8|nr:uncharacterized protein N7479_011303 [Penicillium vulpinum]KAJ5952890.1 hypothetical protein N7479_011303 [Penicillium vulpinum]